MKSNRRHFQPEVTAAYAPNLLKQLLDVYDGVQTSNFKMVVVSSLF